MVRRLARLSFVAATAVVVVLLTQTPSQAHVSSVAGVARCDKAGKDLVVTWTLENRYPAVATIKDVVLDPPASAVKPPERIAAMRDGRPGTVSVSYHLPVSAKKAAITYRGVWPDRFTKQFGTSITVMVVCTPPTPVASTTPSATPSATSLATPSPAPSTSAPSLPVTGSNSLLFAGAGATLTLGGALLRVLGRRRRDTPHLD
jgi:LPXTG-motif cell wall-anchored protein